MPDNRLTLTIEAQNLAQAAFKQLQADVRQSNEALKKSGDTARQSSGGIKVYRDELGRFHDAVTGRYVSASRLLREGFTEVERSAGGATDAIKRVNPVIARMRQEYNLLRTDIHNTAAVSRQFAGAIQAQIRVQVDAAANLERLRVGLVSITGSIAGAEQQYHRLVEVSRLPGINIENSLRATLQLQALGKSGEDATEIIREFGNALALSGTAPRELQQVINAIRQMAGEGKIIQEDIAILTTRVAALVPHLKAAFGGTRAEDVREFFDALGVDESEQADRFLRIVLDRLKELPRAGETASNAIENLSDTTQRVQAVVGGNFLPIVKEATAGIEALLMQVEQDEGLARNIATVEAFGASWLGVTAALTGVAAAIPAVSAAVSFLFTGPAAIAVGVVATLTAGLVAWKVASQEVESEVDRLNSTIDQNRRALVSYQEAVTSGQLGDIQSAQRGIQTQRQEILRNIEGLIAERQRVQEQRDQLQSQTRFQQFQGFEPSQARQDRLSDLNTQIQNLNKSIEAAKFEFLELGQSRQHLNELGKPLVDANINTEELTKSIKDLKAELEEEVAFETVSRGLLGADADFRKSATALADIETLVRLNADAYEKLEKAAASGNQEAVKGLGAVNKELNALRDAAADRHINNLSLAFEKLSNTTDPSRKQFEEILKSAEAFAVTFQGGADVLQDDVARALALISQVREQRQALNEEVLRLEVHDESAESLTEALLRFHDLQRAVQEDAGLDAQQSAEKQATAYIRAYRDSIDPAILNLVESVRLLREEVRGTIQDLEALNLQDELRIELNAENLSPAADFFTELVDLQQTAQGDLTRSQIENLEKRSQALKQQISEDTFNFAAYADDIEAIEETLTDKRLSLLEGEVAARQAQYEDDLRAQRQVEDAKQKKAEETHDFHSYLLGLRRDSIKGARQEFTRLEERALDASSQRQRENLIRETQQFVDAYAERGEAFRGLVADAQELGAELQDAFDFSEQQRRLEDFRDGLAGIIADLSGVAIDHVFDNFFGAADEATEAIQTFTDVFRGDIELLENDVTRLARQVEDSKIRLLRLDEDEERRIRQLEQQRRSLLARASTGNQRDAERTRQRAQDISFRIANLREDFDVRRTRAQEDADRRRNRAIDDAVRRRERFDTRQSDEGLLTKLIESLTGSLSNALSSKIGDVIAGALAGALGGQFTSLLDGIKGLFGGGDGEQQTQTPAQQQAQTPDAQQGEADVDGTIKKLTVDPNLATPSVDVAGLIKSATQATDGYAIPSIDAKGRITSAELSESAQLPSVPNLRGGISDVVLMRNAQLPIVPELTASIGTVAFSEDADTPSLPGYDASIASISFAEGVTPPALSDYAALIGSIAFAEGVASPALPAQELLINSVKFSDDIDFPNIPAQPLNISSIALAEGVTVPLLSAQALMISSVSFDADIDYPSLPSYEAMINSVKLVDGIDLPDVTGLAGRIDSVALAQDIDLPTIRIPATAVVGPVTGGQVGGQFRGVDTEEDPENPRIDGDGLAGAISSLSIDPAALASIQPVMLSGVIKPTLDLSGIPDPIVLRGRIDATVNYLTGANVGGGGGQGRPANQNRDEDPVQRSQVAEDLSTIARVLENATVSGNLNPELGPTPRVDIPIPNLDVDNAPVPGASHPQGFGDTLGEANQFAPRAGGGGRAGATTGALRVTFPTEVLSKLAQEETLSKHFESANQHLAVMRTFIANDMFPAINTQLAVIAENTRVLTEVPLVEALASPSAPALEDVPVGLQDKSIELLDTLQRLSEIAGPTPNLAEMPSSSEGNPMYMHMVNQREVQDVRLVGGKIESVGSVDSVGEIRKQVNVKQVGTIAVTQSGEWVMRLASGGTIPVYVEGGRIVADIEGGLEGLALSLADEEVALRAVGAI